MQKIELQISIDNIVHAFRTINNPNTQPSSIQAANQYLIQCEHYAHFVIVLFKLSLCAQEHVALQSLLLATNVIKRNWKKNNRRTYVAGDLTIIKEDIKKIVLNVYEHQFPSNVKHINELFKFLIRSEYPKNYIDFQQFILKRLDAIKNNDESISLEFVSQKMLPFLSTVKATLKQYSLKIILHENDNFINYVVPIINMVLIIQSKLKQSAQQIISQFLKNPLQNEQLVVVLFQAYRRCYKIVMYGLHSLESSLQTNKEVQRMVFKYVQQIKNYRQLLSQWKDKQDIIKIAIQKNMIGLLDTLSKMQGQFPFIFTQFLDSYISQIIALLLHPQLYKLHKMHTQPIKCVTKLFQINPYLTLPKQYQNRNKSNKNKSLYIKEQQICFRKFTTIFSEQNIIQLLQKIVSELLSFHLQKKRGVEEEIGQNFDDRDQEYLSIAINDLSSSQLLLILVRNITKSFKNASYKVIKEVLNYLINLEQSKQDQLVFDKWIQLIIMMPKLYDTTELPIQSILQLLEILYNRHEYINFTRLIRAYLDHFDTGSFKKLFILSYKFIQMPSSDVSHKVLYYSLLCIKKMITIQQQIPQECLQGCTQKIFELLKSYGKNPQYLWQLVSLANQFVKCLSQLVITDIADRLIYNLNSLTSLKNSPQLLVMGLCDMLLNLISVMPRLCDTSINNCANFISINLHNKNLQTPQILFKFLLQLTKKYETGNCAQETNKLMRQIMQSWSHRIQKLDPQTYLQLIEQQMLAGLIYISKQQLASFINKYNLKGQQTNLRISMPVYSLYFSFSLKTNSYIEDFVLLIVRDFIKLQEVKSPYYNILKTLLLTIFNHHIICFGVSIYNTIENTYPNHNQWFYAYCANLQYATSKYAYKVITLGLIDSLEYFCSKKLLLNRVKEIIPMQVIIKVMMIQLDPIKYQKALTSFANLYKLGSKLDTNMKKQLNPTLNRKICLQISQDLCKQNLNEIFKSRIKFILSLQHQSEEQLKNVIGESNYNKMKTIMEDKNYQFQNTG